MAEDDNSAEDRTEAPSAKRLQRARESGQIPVSRDLTMLASLGGAALGGFALVPAATARMIGDCAGMLGMFGRIRLDNLFVMRGELVSILVSAIMLVGAVAVPAAVCAIGCVLVQTQFYVGGAPIRFEASRISPIAGFSRIFSWRQVLDFLKSLARLAVLSLLAWAALRRSFGEAAVMDVDAARLLPAAWTRIEELARPMLMVLAISAAADVFLTRFQHARSMRMTREEVRRDAKESDGDPVMKGKLRRIRLQRSRRRMMAKVKLADVIITNPTHYAVALAYERGGGGAPRVIAKGVDFVAARIREEAEAHGIPLAPNPPLARALYLVDLDHEIPAEHYRAVAEVIAFVWKLRGPAIGAVPAGAAAPGANGIRP